MTAEKAALDLPRRVIVVDDDSLVRDSLCGHLEGIGCEVVGAVGDGASALSLCEGGGVDLAVVDQRMPGMSGLEFSRAMFSGFGVPSVLCTAYPEEARHLVEGCSEVGSDEETGVFGIVVKPAAVEQLVASVRVAWSRYRQGAAMRAEVAALRARLEDRRVIERAKWRLVEGFGLREDAALRGLQKHARSSQRRLVEVSRAVLADAGELREVAERAGRARPD